MNTKIVLAGAALVAFVLPINADEKGDARSPAPPVLTFEIPNLRMYGPLGDSAFVIPLPKDESDFTVKPPPGAVIENPALKQKSRDKQSPPGLALPKMPPLRTTIPPPRALAEILRDSPKWGVNNAALSHVLQTIAQVYEIKIVTCFTPEKSAENPKITMRLVGKTANEKLDKLKILGLVWRKIGETYFVAWSENDLPPLQNAVPKK